MAGPRSRMNVDDILDYLDTIDSDSDFIPGDESGCTESDVMVLKKQRAHLLKLCPILKSPCKKMAWTSVVRFPTAVIQKPCKVQGPHVNLSVGRLKMTAVDLIDRSPLVTLHG
ncbi:uncharacterized protein LOC110834400 [Zootermopsis nevadensis]|uniref:uncharacterized protein LOC110834400 n=1 Tax=Zootermopsis nevadensis TaxID=136037 RepID=UPI000B8E373F|nr:uncharacterized protein LOC110834400 [Zootermopsis nevadensis]